MLNPDEIKTADNDSTMKIKINQERTWDTFANHTVKTYQKNENSKEYSFATVSCESFHDGIHVLIGTGKPPPGLESKFTGHMGDTGYAAVSGQLILSRCS